MKHDVTEWHFSTAEATLEHFCLGLDWQPSVIGGNDTALHTLDLELYIPESGEPSEQGKVAQTVQVFLAELHPDGWPEVAPYSKAPLGALWRLESTLAGRAFVRIRLICDRGPVTQVSLERELGWALRAWLRTYGLQRDQRSGLVLFAELLECTYRPVR